MQSNRASAPVWFWIIAGAALVWNIVGVLSFVGFATMTPDAIAEKPVAEQALLANTPVWSTIAFAIGVFGGVFGCVFLLLKKKLAIPFFIVSLIAVIAQFSYWLFMTDSIAVYGAQNAFTMPVLVTAIAVALIWFAMSAKRKNWLY